MLNLERFVGKVAVVTGASSGIGVANVETLVSGITRRAHRVVTTAGKLKNEPGKLHAYKCDLTVEDEIISTFKEIISDLGDIHILVNNAGLMLHTDLINGETSKWKKCFDTNVLTLCIASREAIQDMKTKDTKSHIIHINSTAGHEVLNMPNSNVYGPSKYAVTAITMTMVYDLERENLPIKVTSVSPGYVKTEFQEVANVPGSVLPKLGLNGVGVAKAVIFALSTRPEVNDEPGKLYAYKCDMTVEDEVVSTFMEIINELGDIHILVNNARLMLETDLINGDTEMWKKCFGTVQKTLSNQTNVIALCIATREAIQNMKTKGTRGHIIHLNSIAGHEIMNFPKTNVYGASKYAVTALTMTLINDLANEELPIKVTSISPGYVKTEFQAVAGLSKSTLPKVGLNSVDVAEAVIYALSTSPHV
ncbi:hypothetical protein YQE_02419, partial [Dendroctonus ponderosae]